MKAIRNKKTGKWVGTNKGMTQFFEIDHDNELHYIGLYSDTMKPYLLKRNDDYELVKVNIVVEENLVEIIQHLERLKNYLSSGETYCFDNDYDLNDSKELEKLINIIEPNR